MTRACADCGTTTRPLKASSIAGGILLCGDCYQRRAPHERRVESVATQDANGRVEPAARERGPREPRAGSRIVDMAQAIKDAAGPLPWRIQPLALDGSVTLLVGRRGEHKSWLTTFACAAVQAGGPFVEPFRVHQGPALLLDAENGPRRIGGRFTLAALGPDAFMVADGRGLRLPAAISEIRGLVEQTGAKLLVLDSLRRLSPGMRENESDDAAPVIGAIAELAQTLEIAVIVIHHRSSKPGAPDSRGSSALEDQVDVVWIVEKVTGDPERHTRRRLRNTKMRDDAERAPVWIDFKRIAGFMTLAEAEPFAGARDDDATAAHDELADRIRALAGQAHLNGGWAPSRVAAAVGSDQLSGTFKRAIGMLLADGEWIGEGQGKARRLRPAQPGQPGQPLRNGPVGPVEDERLFHDEEAP